MTSLAERDLADVNELLDPKLTLDRQQVLARPCPVPPVPGVYAWYFDELPPGVPELGCHKNEWGWLLYVGISPKAPPKHGGRPSKQSLRTRIRYHFRGNAAGSTLRLTLGSLLAEKLAIELRRVGSGRRLTFAQGEEELSEWMSAHARVCWVPNREPWKLEELLIRELVLPLNLDQNKHSGFHAELSAARSRQRMNARQLAVLESDRGAEK